MMPTHAGKNIESPTGYGGQTNPQTTLKPCPICKSNDVCSYYSHVDDRLNCYDPVIECSNCGIIFKFKDTQKIWCGTLRDIATVWNQRVID